MAAKRKTKAVKARASFTLPNGIINRLQNARHLVFDAQSIAKVARAAAIAQTPADEQATETTLRLLANMLDEVARLIEPGSVAAAAEVRS